MSSWFESEVYVHQDCLRSYLKGKFPTLYDVDDVVQESYLRICKVRAKSRIHFGKAFLFQVARRLAIDFVRRRRKSPVQCVDDVAGLGVIEEGPGTAESLCRKEEILLLAKAFGSLPPRCRDVMIFKKIENLSYREISERLGIGEATVQTHVITGLRKLEEFFLNCGAAK